MTASYRSIFRAGLFDGQMVVVTGGGSGMGRCIAHELAALGANLALVGRKIEKLEKVQAEIAASAPERKVTIHSCDIREEEPVRETVAAIVREHGTINGLVNNAGGQFHAPLSMISAKGWDSVVRNNLTGGFLMARECVNQSMVKIAGKDQQAAIVNIIADMWNGMPGMAHSGAARAGMLNFTETAALEWGPIRVNAVAPGWIASSGMDNYPKEIGEMIRGLPKFVPAARLGTESEIAAAVVFLLSEAANFISGSCLRVDGAAPNAKRLWPQVGSGRPTPEFNGFHLATKPKVLEG